MQNFLNILSEHIARYPKMEPTDLVKLVYQSTFGGGHLLSDREAARHYLLQETSAAPRRDAPTLEAIGGDIFRLHLGSLPEHFAPDTVFELFAASTELVRGEDATFTERMEAAKALPLPFSREALEAYLSDYLAGGLRPVSHSESYRAAYDPHYRIVAREYAKLYPLLCAIEEQRAHGPVRILLDGPSGTGKSTLASKLQSIYRCPVYHMDDYFLQPEQSTPERLSTPGGNVDYERFYEEISRPVMAGEAVTYRPYLCQVGHLGGAVTHEASDFVIIEGAYSNHEHLRAAGTLRVKLTLPLATRLARIRARDGEAMLQRFLDSWIPMEDLYFQHMATDDTYDMIVVSD